MAGKGCCEWRGSGRVKSEKFRKTTRLNVENWQNQKEKKNIRKKKDDKRDGEKPKRNAKSSEV